MYRNNMAAAIRVSSKVCKECDGHVFLPFNTDYSIRLRNYNSTNAVVQISIDGKDIASGVRFVVPPNSSTDIERWLEKNNQEGHKFKFVRLTDRIRDYRGELEDDGIVRVEYWFEKPVYWNTTAWSTTALPPKVIHYTYTGDFVPDPLPSITCSGMDSGSAGITVNGEISNQEFSDTSVDTLEGSSSVIVLKLVGEIGDSVVGQPVTRTTKAKCPVCGTSNRYLQRYCAHCGNNLH